MGIIFHWPRWYPKETTTLVNDKLLKKSVLVLKKKLQEIKNVAGDIKGGIFSS